MSILNSFDYIAALSPALRVAINNGSADPHRWKTINDKLTDSKTGERWYAEDKSDDELENEAIEKWLRKIECRQLIPSQELKKFLSVYKKKWQDMEFESIESLRIGNIHDSAEDYQTYWACKQIDDFLDENNIQLNESPNSYDSGLLTIYGMGSCREISRIINLTKPKIILIFEDNIDVISSRLIQEDEAKFLLSASQINHSTLFFITDTDAELAIQKAISLIEMISLRAHSYSFSFAFKRSSRLDLIHDELVHKDTFAKSLRYQGFFTDELHMLMNGILTFSHTNAKIIRHTEVRQTKRHAVIVASGPSLKKEIPKLKKNRDQYDLFCAFSTLGALLKENIKPDYHCHIERHDDKNFVQSTEVLKDFCKSGVLLTSANVDPRLAQQYKKVYAILRSASSSSALHVENPEDIIYSEGTNAGTFAVTVAIILGYNVIHIFGLDLGATDQSNLRMKGALNKSDRQMNIEVEGNLRESVWTDQYLRDSATMLGYFLDPKIADNRFMTERASEIRVYNYSDGQKIPHTISSSPSSFDKNLRTSQPLPDKYNEKIRAINEGSKVKVYEKLIAYDLENKIKLQCQILRKLGETPLKDNSLDSFLQSCTDRMSDFSNRGSKSDQILVRLLGGTLSRVWIYMSIISRLIPNQEKDKWEQESKRILCCCIDSIESLSLEMLQYASSIKNLEDHVLQSILRKKR